MSFKPDYFETLHAESADPWAFRTRWYEQRKRALTLALLPASHFTYGFEPGCSIGELTAALAPRCDRLLAWDVSESALVTAGARLANFPHVVLERFRVPDAWPAGQPDLVVISEIAYFLTPSELRRLIERVEQSLASGGALLLCHWRHPVVGSELNGDRVHQEFSASRALKTISRLEETDFLMSVMTKEGRSIAEIEGIL